MQRRNKSIRRVGGHYSDLVERKSQNCVSGERVRQKQQCKSNLMGLSGKWRNKGKNPGYRDLKATAMPIKDSDRSLKGNVSGGGKEELGHMQVRGG